MSAFNLQEIIEEVHKAHEIGITIVHILARDEEKGPTFEKEVYGLIFEGIRKFCNDLIICSS